MGPRDKLKRLKQVVFRPADKVSGSEPTTGSAPSPAEQADHSAESLSVAKQAPNVQARDLSAGALHTLSDKDKQCNRLQLIKKLKMFEPEISGPMLFIPFQIRTRRQFSLA